MAYAFTVETKLHMFKGLYIKLENELSAEKEKSSSLSLPWCFQLS